MIKQRIVYINAVWQVQKKVYWFFWINDCKPSINIVNAGHELRKTRTLNHDFRS